MLPFPYASDWYQFQLGFVDIYYHVKLEGIHKHDDDRTFIGLSIKF